MAGVLRLESLTKGNTLKQGDLTLLKYRLLDADGDKIDISEKPATVRLMKNDFTFIAYEKGGLTVASDDTVSFSINKVLPAGLYYLEIIVDDNYIFPSRDYEGKFNVDKSTLGADINIVEATGVEAVARKATFMMKQDEEFIDDMIANVISDTNVGNIEEYYNQFNEATTEFENLKTQALNSVTKSNTAITDSALAKSIAQGIDAKATNALNLSESADTLSKSVQEQFNQVVIDGDSSVESAQARVDASGQTNATLKARLDKEHNEVTTQLARIVTLVGSRVAGELYDNPRIQRAIDSINMGGGEVLIPKGHYHIDPNKSIVIPTNVKLSGSGMSSSILYTDQRRSVKMVEIIGSNVNVNNIGFDLKEYDETTNLTEISCIEINNSVDNVMIDQCLFKNGYAGVWLNPNVDSIIKHVKIINSTFDKFRHHIYLGYTKMNRPIRSDLVTDVLIDNNTIINGLFDGDGIKTVQRCKDIIISNNFIAGHKRDAIDLYTSGDNIIVTGNVLKENKLGIDIKQFYPEEDHDNELYGYNKQIIISDNVISDNDTHGVSVAYGGVPMINVSGNTISNNGMNGVFLHGRYVNVVNNLIFNNGHSDNASYRGIDVYGLEDTYTSDINIDGNIVLNNGSASLSNERDAGIYLRSYIKNVNITNNLIGNDEVYGGAYQKIGLFIGNLSYNISVYNNKISNHLRNVLVLFDTSVNCERETVKISVSELDDVYNIPFPIERDIVVTDVKIITNKKHEGNTPALHVGLRKTNNGEYVDSNIISVNSTQVVFEPFKEVKLNSFNTSDINDGRDLIENGETPIIALYATTGVIQDFEATLTFSYITL